ncbi:reverse transcriptase domain-containing protein, partial [Tanacetum coccineum]
NFDWLSATAKDTVVVTSPAVDELVIAVGNTKDVNVGQTPISSIVDLNSGTSYAKLFTGKSSRKSVNFRTLIMPAGNGTDVIVPLESIRSISERFSNTAYSFFLGKRVAYPVFSSMDGLDLMLENSLWFIRNNLLILKKWNLDVNLLKEYVVNVSFWVKLHGGPVIAFSEDGLSVIATKLGTPLMLDSYTSDMCMQLWGRSSYARAMIKLRVDVELKILSWWLCLNLLRRGFIRDECPNNIGSYVAKNNPRQASKGVSVGHKVRFKPLKQVYRPISKKNNVNTSGNKKKDAKSRKEVSNPNQFYVLNSVENHVDLGTNGRTSNLASKEANSSGSSFWNVGSSSISTTPIVEKIDKIQKLFIDGK